jgi:hypothetical protein
MKGGTFALIGVAVLLLSSGLSCAKWGLDGLVALIVVPIPLDIAASWYFVKNTEDIPAVSQGPGGPWLFVALIFTNLVFFLLWPWAHDHHNTVIEAAAFIGALVAGFGFWELIRRLENKISPSTEMEEAVKQTGGGSSGLLVWFGYFLAGLLAFLWAWAWLWTFPDEVKRAPKLSAMVPPPEKGEKKGWGEAAKESGA